MDLKILSIWLVSLVGATVTTFILWLPLDIPFIEGGAFTLISILLLAVVFALTIDLVVGAGIHDEHGWHLGIGNPMGPLVPDDREPDDEPILSREERRKRKA